MPTENRSSTEMVSVPRELAEEINSVLYDHDLNGLTVRLQELLDKPEQRHGEPVAHCFLRKNGYEEWVNDARHWEDGPPGPAILAASEKYPELYQVRLAFDSPADAGEVERLRAEVKRLDLLVAQEDYNYDEDRANFKRQLDERDALLREQSGKLIVLAVRLLQEPLRALNGDLDGDGPITRVKVANGVERAGDSLGGLALEIRRAADALSAIVAPAAPAPKYPHRLCHIDYQAHPYRCGCLRGDEEAQKIYDDHMRSAKS